MIHCSGASPAQKIARQWQNAIAAPGRAFDHLGKLCGPGRGGLIYGVNIQISIGQAQQAYWAVLATIYTRINCGTGGVLSTFEYTEYRVRRIS